MSEPPSYQPYQPYSGPPGPVQAPTNSLAIASLIVSCLGLFTTCIYGLGIVPAAAGAIMGHVARGQIRRSGENGAGLALAAVIIGWAATGLILLFVAFVVVVFVIAGATYDTANA